MFMLDTLDSQELQVRRYTVVGNDSSFKAYTKEQSYFQVQGSQPKQSLEESVLRVTLKDNPKQHTDDTDGDGRQQYRVVHTDLMFVIEYSG
jgi:hypothetical protein